MVVVLGLGLTRPVAAASHIEDQAAAKDKPAGDKHDAGKAPEANQKSSPKNTSTAKPELNIDGEAATAPPPGSSHGVKAAVSLGSVSSAATTRSNSETGVNPSNSGRNGTSLTSAPQQAPGEQHRPGVVDVY